MLLASSSVVLHRVLIFLAFAFSSLSHASDTRLYTSTQIEAYSDTFTLYDLHKNQFKTYDKGDLTYAFFRFESGVEYQNYRLSLIQRRDMYAEYSADTSELIYSSKSQVTLAKNKRFDVDLGVSQIDSNGIVFGYQWQISPAFSLLLESQLLKAKRITDGTIQGVVETFSDTFEGDLELDYGYTKDALLGRKPESPKGQGVALDVSLFWNVNKHNSLSLKVKDLYHNMEWDDLTYTEASLSRRPIRYDEDGKINAKASIKGFEGYRSQRISLPARAYLSWQHEFAHISRFGQIALTLFSFSDKHQKLTATYFLKYYPEWYFSANTERAMGIGYKGRYAHFYLASDALNLKKANSFSSNLSFMFSF